MAVEDFSAYAEAPRWPSKSGGCRTFGRSSSSPAASRDKPSENLDWLPPMHEAWLAKCGESSRGFDHRYRIPQFPMFTMYRSTHDSTKTHWSCVHHCCNKGRAATVESCCSSIQLYFQAFEPARLAFKLSSWFRPSFHSSRHDFRPIAPEYVR